MVIPQHIFIETMSPVCELFGTSVHKFCFVLCTQASTIDLAHALIAFNKEICTKQRTCMCLIGSMRLINSAKIGGVNV